MQPRVKAWLSVAEQIGRADWREHHEVVLVHRAEAKDSRDLPDAIRHNERPKVKALWRTLGQLAERPVRAGHGAAGFAGRGDNSCASPARAMRHHPPTVR